MSASASSPGRPGRPRPPIDYAWVNLQGLLSATSLIERLLPGGRWRRDEWVVANPTRNERKAGSFSVSRVTGKSNDLGTGKGTGNLISTVAAMKGGISQFEAALWICRELSIEPGGPGTGNASNGTAGDFTANGHGFDMAEVQKEAARRTQEDEAARVAVTRRLARESRPVSDALSEQYLTQQRRIPRPSGGWPDCVRHHEESLLLVGTTDDGAVQFVQQIFWRRPQQRSRASRS